jgi:hypothetical protein
MTGAERQSHSRGDGFWAVVPARVDSPIRLSHSLYRGLVDDERFLVDQPTALPQELVRALAVLPRRQRLVVVHLLAHSHGATYSGVAHELGV